MIKATRIISAAAAADLSPIELTSLCYRRLSVNLYFHNNELGAVLKQKNRKEQISLGARIAIAPELQRPLLDGLLDGLVGVQDVLLYELQRARPGAELAGQAVGQLGPLQLPLPLAQARVHVGPDVLGECSVSINTDFITVVANIFKKYIWIKRER